MGLLLADQEHQQLRRGAGAGRARAAGAWRGGHLGVRRSAEAAAQGRAGAGRAGEGRAQRAALVLPKVVGRGRNRGEGRLRGGDTGGRALCRSATLVPSVTLCDAGHPAAGAAAQRGRRLGGGRARRRGRRGAPAGVFPSPGNLVLPTSASSLADSRLRHYCTPLPLQVYFADRSAMEASSAVAACPSLPKGAQSLLLQALPGAGAGAFLALYSERPR